MNDEQAFGLDLCERYWKQCVAAIFEEQLAGLTVSAARIGAGSDVLGFDTALSRDHDWGPKLTVFVDEEQIERVQAVLAARVPASFEGYETRPAAHADGTMNFLSGDEGAAPAIEVTTLDGYLRRHFGAGGDVDVTQPSRWTNRDWLRMPSQQLLAVTAGRVFRDDDGRLGALRRQLDGHYPGAVRAYLLASGWRIVGQEAHLMSRAGHAGDELGSALIGATVCRCLMRMAFVYERRYAPYQKWFGTAFARLPCAEQLAPALRAVVAAPTWQEREAALCAACSLLADLHRRSGLTEAPLPDAAARFHQRPFFVFPADDYQRALLATVDDDDLPLPPIGSVDFWSDHTDVRESGHSAPALKQLFSDCHSI